MSAPIATQPVVALNALTSARRLLGDAVLDARTAAMSLDGARATRATELTNAIEVALRAATRLHGLVEAMERHPAGGAR